MSLLSYTELCELIDRGVISKANRFQQANTPYTPYNPYANVNGTSIDLTLDDIIRVEDSSERHNQSIDISKKESIFTREVNVYKIQCGYALAPGEFILASSWEIFNLPNDISAEYKLKSTMARNGLEHLNAGWCDPSWSNSRLTLELINITRHHHLVIRPGMKIGQVVFFKSEPVPDHASYANKGQYNNQSMVTASKGLR